MKNLSLLFVFVMLCTIAGVTYAAPPEIDYSRFESVSNGYNHFYQNVAPFIQKVISNSEISNFSIVLWKFFSAVLIVWQTAQYNFGKLTFWDLFSNIILISITLVLMENYDDITSILWSWSEDFATSIQVCAVGVDDELFVPRYVWNLFTSFSWSVENVFFHISSLISIIILSLTSVVICVLSILTTIWGMWGYSLAKIIGLMFIPTILFEPLSWLFNGWLRFFFGFLIYNVMAKAGLMLVIMALSAYLNIPDNQVPLHGGYHIAINSIMDVLGLLVFSLVSIVGLICTGIFTKAIVSGAQTGSLRAAIVSGSKALMGST